MNRGKQRSFSIGGYTIVETLIFLAVSSVIFMAALVLVGGRQTRAEFQSGVRDFETRLADIANDVATGYYQNAGVSRQCNEGPNGPEFSGGNVSLGTNRVCTFVGTVVKLGSGAGPSGDQQFIQFTMAGLRLSGGDSVTSLAQAKPKILDNGTGFEPHNVGYGIRVACIAVEGVNGGACTSENAAIGFFSTFEGASLSGQGGGAVQADVISYGSLASIADNATIAQTAVNGFTGYNSPTLNRQITICLIGGSNQYALVRLGGNASSSLAVTSEIKEGASCS